MEVTGDTNRPMLTGVVSDCTLLQQCESMQKEFDVFCVKQEQEQGFMYSIKNPVRVVMGVVIGDMLQSLTQHAQRRRNTH